MPMFTPEKALRDFPKTPVILSAILQGVARQHAPLKFEKIGGLT